MRVSFLLFLTIASGLGASLAFSDEVTASQKREILGEIQFLLESQAFAPGADFKRWNAILDEHREAIDVAKEEDDFAKAVTEAFQAFGVSHLVLFSPKNLKAMGEARSVGLGASFKPLAEGLQIVRVLPDSPAAEAGLRIGEIVIEADGVAQPKAIRGKEGETNRLRIKARNGAIRRVALVRRAFKTLTPASLSWVDDRTAVLAIPTFYDAYDVEQIEALMREASRAEYLIVDLRFNRGGYLGNVTLLLGYFLPPGTEIGASVGAWQQSESRSMWGAAGDDLLGITLSHGERLRVVEGAGVSFRGAVAVLIDENTMSAAEIATAAFREQMHAPVIGVKSAGAVLVAEQQSVGYGFMLQFPASDYVTIFGRHLEGNGIVPDVEVRDQLRLPGYEDLAVWKARLLLERQRRRQAGA